MERSVVTITADVWIPGATQADQISVAVPIGFLGQAAKYTQAGEPSFVVVLIVDGWDGEQPVHRLEIHRTS